MFTGKTHYFYGHVQVRKQLELLVITRGYSNNIQRSSIDYPYTNYRLSIGYPNVNHLSIDKLVLWLSIVFGCTPGASCDRSKLSSSKVPPQIWARQSARFLLHGNGTWLPPLGIPRSVHWRSIWDTSKIWYGIQVEVRGIYLTNLAKTIKNI